MFDRESFDYNFEQVGISTEGTMICQALLHLIFLFVAIGNKKKESAKDVSRRREIFGAWDGFLEREQKMFIWSLR